MSYYENRKRARTENLEPTETDQSGAAQTDMNIIVTQLLKTGQGPGNPVAPMYGDFTNLPRDLRETIETCRGLKDIRNNLPEQLKDKPIEDLLLMTREDIDAILAPKEPPKETPE